MFNRLQDLVCVLAYYTLLVANTAWGKILGSGANTLIFPIFHAIVIEKMQCYCH